MFNWEDYLKLSELWKELDESEILSDAYYRSAISRAYYCVYHKVKQFASENGYEFNDQYESSRHKEMLDYLNENRKGGAGRYFSRLRKNRTDSDYEADEVVDKRRAIVSFRFAENIISDLAKN